MVTEAKRIPGVTEVRANLAAARLTLRYDPSMTTEAKVATALSAIVDRLDR